MVVRSPDLDVYLSRISSAVRFAFPDDAASHKIVWRGAEHHQPPMRAHPLSERLKRKSNASILLLVAGFVLLASRRLMPFCNVRPTVDVAEALYCFTVAPQYFDANFSPVDVGRDTPELDASHELRSRLIGIVEDEDYEKMGAPPLLECLRALHFSRQILGKAFHPTFDKWADSAIDNLDDVDERLDNTLTFYDFGDDSAYAAHVEQVFGEPQPFEVLGSPPPSPEDRARLIDEYLQSLDPESNPFLRTPAALRDVPRVPEPYSFGKP